MVRFLVVLSLVNFSPTFTLIGTAEVVEPWCGGAAAPPGREETRFPDTEVYVVKPGDQNSEAAPIATIAPKSDGTFKVKLPEGKWCVVEKARAARPPSGLANALPAGTVPGPGEPDTSCLDAAWRQCVQVIEVDHRVRATVALTRYRACSWAPKCRARGVIPSSPP